MLDAPLADTTPDGIVHAMIGRELDNLFPEITPAGDEIGLSVRGLQLHADGPVVDLDVRKGEILGLGGLVGAGRSEVVEAIFGVRRSIAGTIDVDGTFRAARACRRGDPGRHLAGPRGPQGRRPGADTVGPGQRQPAASRRLLHRGLAHDRKRSAAVSDATRSVRLKSDGLGQLVGNLSGGNQQKIVLARWLTQNCSVLLLDEPTRGVDVGARGEIYTIVRDLAAKGLAVILVSSDMPELIGLSHRVLVMRSGGVAGELSRDELDRARRPGTHLPLRQRPGGRRRMSDVPTH